MDFGKIKTILIYLLLCVNIFLLVAFLIQSKSRSTIPLQTVTDAIDALAIRNIAVTSDIVPREKPGFYVATVELEEDFAQQTGEALFSKRFNVRQHDGSSIWIEADDGSFKLFSKSELAFEKKALPGTVLTEAYAQKCIERFFKSMRFKKDDYEVVSSANTENGGIRITVLQKLNGKQIFDCALNAEFDKDGNQRFIGRWVFGRLASSVDTSASDVLNLLFDFAKHIGASKDKVSITEIKDGFLYSPGSNSTLETTRLFPGWYLETATGDRYYYDAVMGSFIDIENIG